MYWIYTGYTVDIYWISFLWFPQIRLQSIL
jgi:hypothetical protein